VARGQPPSGERLQRLERHGPTAVGGSTRGATAASRARPCPAPGSGRARAPRGTPSGRIGASRPRRSRG
jgi:hypothetical protein